MVQKIPVPEPEVKEKQIKVDPSFVSLSSYLEIYIQQSLGG